jgi:urea transporter
MIKILIAAALGGVVGFFSGFLEAGHRRHTNIGFHVAEGVFWWAVLGGTLAYRPGHWWIALIGAVVGVLLHVPRLLTLAERRQDRTALLVSGILHGITATPAMFVVIALLIQLLI